MDASDKTQDTKPEEKADVLDSPVEQKLQPKAPIYVAILLVVLATGITHWPALSTKATAFDDNQYLTQNPLVQYPSWYSVKRFFCEVLKPSTVKGHYQPVTMISHMLDFAIAGDTDDLTPYHRTSLCLHLANTALVVVILYMLFKSIWPAAMVALLFGVHPLIVEQVAWISERKTVLAGLFTFISLISYLTYARGNSRRSYATCILMYVMALLCKPISIPLPLMLLVLDYWPLNRLSLRVLKEKTPLFVIGVIFTAIIIISHTRAAWTTMPTKGSLVANILILCHNTRFYLNMLFWPTSLSAYYPLPQPLALSDPAISKGILTTVVVIVVLLVSLRHTRALMAGFLFFLIAILPTAQIIGFSSEIAANRFMYLPFLGLLLPATWFLTQIWNKPVAQNLRIIRQAVTIAVVAALAAGASFVSRSYIACWKDTATLYTHMRNLAPDAPMLNLGLASGLAEQGKIDEAIEACRRELQNNPDSYKALNILGALLAKKGDIAEAIKYFTKALEIKPDDFAARFNLATMLAKNNQPVEAIGQLKHAITIAPTAIAAHYNLASLLLQQGRNQEAAEHFRIVLRAKPNLAAAQAGLEAALAKPAKTALPEPNEPG